MDTETFVKMALLERGATVAQTNDPAFDYVAAGLVDSLSMLRFVLELEEALEVSIDDATMQDPRFRTVGGLTEVVQELRS